MLEQLARFVSARPAREIVRDLFDILIVAFIIYRALLVLRGTRAMQMAIGLGILVAVYLLAKALHLTTLLWLLSSVLASIVLIVVVVFQNDIRRALIRVGTSTWFSAGREQQSRVIDEVVAAATELARHRMGALIAFEQDANVLEFVKSDGIVVDSVVTRELLVSLFVPESVNKLHDGAVLIRDLRVARAGVFFPMPESRTLDAQFGSRHRAALGITEETDAVVVVVSEERGTISFCFSGNIVSNLDGQSLRHALNGLFGRSDRKKRLAKKSAAAPAPGPAAPSPPLRPPAQTPPPGRTSVIHPPPVSKTLSGSTKMPLSQPMRPGKLEAPLDDEDDEDAPPSVRPAQLSSPSIPPAASAEPKTERAPTSLRSPTFVPMPTSRVTPTPVYGGGSATTPPALGGGSSPEGGPSASTPPGDEP